MRTAIYARVGTATPAKHDTIEQTPIEQQIARLYEHIVVRGERLADEHVFRDEGRGGGTLDRPALHHLRAHVSLGKYERVLVTSPDRLTRDPAQLRALIDEFERKGCRIEFVD